MNRIARLSLLTAAIAAGLAAHAAAVQFSGAARPAGSSIGALPAARTPAALGNPGINAAVVPGVNAGLPGITAAITAGSPAASLPGTVSPAAAGARIEAASAPGQRPGSLQNLDQMAAPSSPDASSAQQFQIGAQQYDGAAVAASYRYPTYSEQGKIDESLRRGAQLSPLANDLINEFRDQGGQFAIDQNGQAAYHGTAFRDTLDRPTVALTLDTISNGSWAFILATVGREIMNFNGWYGVVPASAERLAIQYAHMAMIFAQATNGSARAWSTNLDHNHMNEGTYFVWAWYEKLLQAATSATVGFIDSEYFVWLRDFVANQTATNPSYQYSLYERLTGTHYRPNSPLHNTPIPANVQRLTQAQHDAASSRVYGADGNGDNGANANLLGYLRGWFGRRGNI